MKKIEYLFATLVLAASLSAATRHRDNNVQCEAWYLYSSATGMNDDVTVEVEVTEMKLSQLK